MSNFTAVKLIKSLSQSEKRQFKLYVKKQSGDKDYLDLFDIIDRQSKNDLAWIEKKFTESHPKASLSNTANYLVKILTECLVLSRIKGNDLYQLLFGLLKVNILKERNLDKESFLELKKLQQPAHSTEELLLQLILYRYELKYHSENNFHHLSEQALIDLQMEVRDTLKEIRNIHEHNSLYDSLKYRLIHSGHSTSEKDKSRLNDLLLSEMGIVSSRAKNNPESRKLHLLFQSYFFTNISDYRSALKTFYELNKLFENNIHIIQNPPIGYFSSLDGILDSLRTMGKYEDMEFYIRRLKLLNSPDYREHFCFLVQKTVLIYTLAALIGKELLQEALQCIENNDTRLLKDYPLLDADKQMELQFYYALTYFKLRKWKKAQKYISPVILINKVNFRSVIYKASRLLNILIHYQQQDFEYLDHEIRSYKRSHKRGKMLKTEKFIFKLVQLNPDRHSTRKNELLWPSLSTYLPQIAKDKFERQLLKYFDFVQWGKEKFGK